LKYESRDARKRDVMDEILHKRRNQMTVPGARRIAEGGMKVCLQGMVQYNVGLHRQPMQ
jgi:predicted SpoU family rRNA methylase